MAFCVNCGQKIADNASFCTHCGAPQTPRMQAPDQSAQSSIDGLGAGYNAGDSYQGNQNSYGYSDGNYQGSQSSYDYSGGNYQGNQNSYEYSGGGYQGNQNSYDYSGGNYQGSQSSYDYSGGNAQGSQSSYDYSGGNAQGSQNSYDYAGSQGTSNGYNYSDNTSTTGAPLPSLTFREAVKTCIREKYVNFNGRARRSEYWYFVLFEALVNLAASLVGSFFIRNEGDINFLASLTSIALFLPALGVTFRRLHDTGKSGWWMLLNALPLIGSIILIIFCCQDSDRGPNLYGQSPKYPG